MATNNPQQPQAEDDGESRILADLDHAEDLARAYQAGQQPVTWAALASWLRPIFEAVDEEIGELATAVYESDSGPDPDAVLALIVTWAQGVEAAAAHEELYPWIATAGAIAAQLAEGLAQGEDEETAERLTGLAFVPPRVAAWLQAQQASGGEPDAPEDE